MSFYTPPYHPGLTLAQSHITSITWTIALAYADMAWYIDYIKEILYSGTLLLMQNQFALVIVLQLTVGRP